MVARARDFACAADEVWRLQRGSDADCILFQRWTNAGRRITDPGTRQGFWVFAPGGEVLGRINSRSPERVTRMLDAALDRWNELSDEARSPSKDIPAAEPAHRWEDGYPEGGLALERFSRDLVDGAPHAKPSPRWNRDTLWFAAAEVRAMLPTEATRGDAFALELFADRLARLALVDDARGQTLPYAPDEVEDAELLARVVAREGDRADLVLQGRTACVAAEEWLLGDNSWTPRRRFPHRIATELCGTATVDLAAGTILDIELVAIGVREGRTTFNGRGRDLGPSPIGFHLAPAPDRLAPTFASLYGVDWIPRPDVPTWRDSPAEAGLGER